MHSFFHSVTVNYNRALLGCFCCHPSPPILVDKIACTSSLSSCVDFVVFAFPYSAGTGKDDTKLQQGCDLNCYNLAVQVDSCGRGRRLSGINSFAHHRK